MLHQALWHEHTHIDTRVNAIDNAVAVYLLPLEAPNARVPAQRYLHLLTVTERARWEEIRPAERQWQYLQARILQRTVLAAYAARAPERLAFSRNQWGRPSLIDCEGVHFSLSHCASHIALAVGSDPVLGVDVEASLPLRPNFMHIARAHFNAADLAQLTDCPDERRYARFLEQWTLKEAYLKALGLGMHKPMADCSFERDVTGALRCDDRALTPEQLAPAEFLAEQRADGCHLALAFRGQRTVRFQQIGGAEAAPLRSHG